MTGDLVTVIGNIGQEPERRTTSAGELVEFSVAQHESVRQPDGSWEQGDTTWFQVKAWDRLGANAAVSLHKGQPVVVHGWLQTREWQGQDGQARRSTTLRARAIGHDLSHGVASFTRPPVAAQAAPVPPPAAPVERGEPQQEPREPAPAGWTPRFAAEGEETPF